MRKFLNKVITIIILVYVSINLLFWGVCSISRNEIANTNSFNAVASCLIQLIDTDKLPEDLDQVKANVDELFKDYDKFNSEYNLHLEQKDVDDVSGFTMIITQKTNISVNESNMETHAYIPTWEIYIQANFEKINYNYFAWALTHEICHCLYPANNEQFTQNKTFEILYNSNNSALRRVALLETIQSILGLRDVEDYDFADFAIGKVL